MSTSSPTRLLYIDDNATNLLLFKSILRQRPDLEFASATTGAEGLEILANSSVDLVFLDVHLPVMNGHEILAAIRSSPSIAATPIIMMTADLAVKQSDYDDDPLTNFFAKPVEVHRLLHLLETEFPVAAKI